MKKKDDFKNRMVYSTNPDFIPQEESDEQETLAANQQTLYVSLERLKGGKIATIVENFIGSKNDLYALGKQLKNKCGSGGTVKEGIILIQGEHRNKIIETLNSLGYKTKRKGG